MVPAGLPPKLLGKQLQSLARGSVEQSLVECGEAHPLGHLSQGRTRARELDSIKGSQAMNTDQCRRVFQNARAGSDRRTR